MNDSRLSDSIFENADGQRRSAPQADDSASQLDAPDLAVHDDGYDDHPDLHDDEEHHRREARTERVPQMSKGRAGGSCVALLLVILLTIGACGYFLVKAVGKIGLFGSGSQSVDSPDYSGQGHGTVDITINPGDSGSAIGRTLEAAGVVKSANTFAAVAGNNTQFSKIQAGTYRMRHEMSSADALTLMLDPASHVSGGIVIREGLWASEIYDILSKKTGVPVKEYQNVDPAKIDLPAAARGNVEGYLFPATYIFPKGASATQQLKMMVDQGNQARAILHIPPAQLHDVVTTASIVQAEAGSADMAKVARVIDNRLKPDNSETNGKLQMDSTIHFVLKKRGTSQVSIQDTKVNSPYNTYQHAGLPPGPINNPGLAAIKAALNPAPGNWYYFVTVDMDTGETLFADTLDEQHRNEAKYRAWCQAHKGRC